MIPSTTIPAPTLLTPARTATAHTLSATLDLPLRPHEIPLLRGAVVEAMGREHDCLHNHRSEGGYLGRYSLVQYRSEQGRAALFALGAGTTALRTLLLQHRQLPIGHRPHDFRILSLHEQEHTVRMLPHTKRYQLSAYLPFNAQLYRAYQAQSGLCQKFALVEKALVGHIFGFANAIGYRLPTRLEVAVLELYKIRPLRVHGHQRIALDLDFAANIDLPEDIALGRSTAFGFGRLSCPTTKPSTPEASCRTTKPR